MVDSPLEDVPADGEAPRPLIMHVITDLDTGGAETMLANLVTAKRPDGEPPLVVSLIPGGGVAARIKAAGITVHDLGMKRGWPSIGALCRLAGLIRTHRPEVIQSWMYHADLIALIALALSRRRSQTRLFWGVRCSDMDVSQYSWSLRRIIGLCARLSRRPNGVIANSHAGRALHRSLGYKPRRFLVVPNGVDNDRFRSDIKSRTEIRTELGLAHSDILIGTSARVDPMKDYPSFLRALSLAEGEGVCGLAAGRGTEKLKDQANLFRLGERSDMPRVLNGFDIYVSASAFGEGFSNALVEAMATGIPVIATDVGDARLIVGDCGIIVPPGDADVLADAINTLKADPDRRAQLGRDARARAVAEFGLAQAVQGFDDLHSDWRL
jgi:glycosyltransferase involved in cell wall biosynthesis